MIKCNSGGCAVAALKTHSDMFKCLKMDWLIIFSGEKKLPFKLSLSTDCCYDHTDMGGKGDREG